MVADSGYGSEQNYDYMEQNEIENYVKFNYFHKEQSPKFRDNPFLTQNLFYNAEHNCYICPMGQRMYFAGTTQKESQRGYKSEVSLSQAQRCQECPLRGSCHKAKGNRVIEINQNLERHKRIARTNLTSEKGLMHRRRRPVEPEAVFGQVKSNFKFNRFTLRGLNGVAVEFGLISIALNLSKMIKKRAIQAKKEQNQAQAA